MAGSQSKPVYTAYITSGSKKYNVTKALTSLDRSDPNGQIAQRVTITLANAKVGDSWLSGIIKARDRITIYADDGTKNAEVYRGFIWEKSYNASLGDRELKYTCYDNLIYFQESQESLYFSAGKSSKDVVSSICEKWGIKLQYSYDSITHEKLPLWGNLSDIFTDDILEKVRKKKKKKYVILSDLDTMVVRPVGANSTVYRFIGGKNVVATASGWSMDGVITKVVITGKADDNDRKPIEATVTGNTSAYGTLQTIESRSENTSLEDAKLEAQNTIDENGKPKNEYEIKAPDIPWIRKGDKVYISAADIEGYKIVTEVDRSFDLKTASMTLTLEDV